VGDNMFESLGEHLQNAIDKIKGYGKITEDNISDMMREIRLALLEADVNYKVVKEFTTKVKEKALRHIESNTILNPWHENPNWPKVLQELKKEITSPMPKEKKIDGVQ
jgi:signal recognition particle GTPase